ncbi:DNA polymerase domain-containing protein [uncultured Parvimonas sp.]|uniref:DNA polymerase domain-containing protein n=1 Tax=uncultured Parvimonas sp. TaxID=747372 RepID=UPI0025966EAC|nr:DNA polymerase domain-containing protein [uncultured Parvimonas sp.]
MKKYILNPKVVRGGKAIPLGNNFYYMRGRKHEQGGIDLGADDKNGLEVEGGEVVHTSKNSIKVFSAVPMLNGKSPAEKVINGENANKVFKEQEEFKDRNNYNDDGSKKYQAGGKRRYIGGNTNEARQKYFDTDKEFTDSVKVIAKRYNINPNLLASRMAKEGPIDKAINYYNDTNGKFDRREVHGRDWGLDDTGNNLNEGIITLKEPYLNYYDEEFFNEKDRKVNSVYSPDWNFGISATAAELKYRRDEMKKRFPNLSDEQLDAAASAAFNRGMYGATKYIKQGRDLNEYSPFINIKKMGGQVKKNIFVELNVGGKKKLVPASSFTGETVKRNNENINNSNFVYVHYDISSFYPSIMTEYEIGPEHLNIHIFSKLIRWLRDTRIEAKHSKQDIIDGIPKNILAEALKIVINSIYGKLGFAYGDLCDRLAVLKVTINGQLMIMMLCEELELNEIEIVSANTDGIVVKLFENKVETFKAITEQWQKDTKLSADSEYYKIYACRDINNYFCQETNGKLTYKGALHPLQYAIDLKKGYDMPIVAKAVVEYFINNTPITETLYKATNILDFCKTQNIGKQFHVEETIIDKNGNTVYKESQRNCRFYVSNNGSIIEKVHNTEKSRGKLCAGFKTTILNSLDDKDISLRDINYQYYYDEAFKIINPIKLGISPALKGNNIKKTKSGKVLIKKYSGAFNTLFDD